MEARFWIHTGRSQVRLGLCDGETLTRYSGGPHEEGYSYTTTVWEREGDTIIMHVATKSRDCDGPLDQYADYAVRIDELDTNNGYPTWTSLRSYQRDYYAEAMGY